jgi:hypothetical protein
VLGVEALAGDIGDCDLACDEGRRVAVVSAMPFRKGHSTPWDMQLRHAGCLSSHLDC